MKVKTIICKSAAKLIKKAAVNASSSASFCGYYQPKEPSALKKLKK